MGLVAGNSDTFTEHHERPLFIGATIAGGVAACITITAGSAVGQNTLAERVGRAVDGAVHVQFTARAGIHTSFRERAMRATHIVPVLAALSLVVVDAGRATSQTIASASDAQAQSQVIAASFSKFKRLSVEKRGIRKEKYLKVESTPAVKANPADYSGTYEIADLGFAIHLRADRTGKVEGDGYEPLNSDPAIRRVFTLGNGKIEGALLTATKVYAGGYMERLEGAFMNRATFESPTDKGCVRFGLGTLGRPVQVSGMTIDKFFYDLKVQ